MLDNRSMAVVALAAFAAGPLAVGQSPWNVVRLNPGGDDEPAVALGVAGGQQVGFAFASSPQRASLWTGTAASWVSLHPAGSDVSFAFGTDGTQQVGEARQPGNIPRASLWTGSAASWVDLTPAGARNASAYAVDSGRQAGDSAVIFGQFDIRTHASLWSGTAASWVDLHPSGAGVGNSSTCTGIHAGQQAGYVEVLGLFRASLWTGSAASWVNLNPAGATASEAFGVHNGQQVGFAQFNGVNHAGFWRGTAASWVDLHPAGATSSNARAVHSGRQAGSARVDGQNRASVWSGTAASWEDLSLALAAFPFTYGDSSANGIFSNGTTLSVVGTAFNNDLGIDEAFLWTRTLPPCAADRDHNGQIEPADVALFINQWFNSLLSGTLIGDFDGSGQVQPADVALFVFQWFGAITNGC